MTTSHPDRELLLDPELAERDDVPDSDVPELPVYDGDCSRCEDPCCRPSSTMRDYMLDVGLHL